MNMNMNMNMKGRARGELTYYYLCEIKVVHVCHWLASETDEAHTSKRACKRYAGGAS